MNKVKVLEPNEGLAFLCLQTEDMNMVDLPLSYTQDITGPFINEFKLYLNGRKNDGHLVLAIDGAEGKYLVIADQERSYVIDERKKSLIVSTANAMDIIKSCMANFVAFMDAWANFDIKDEPGNSLHYTSDFLDRKALIESSEDEINPYLRGR